jgi:hypothetical protein
VLITRGKTLEQKPAMVRNVVEACREGWRKYLDDPAAANAAMGKLNTEMDAETFKEAAAAQKSLIENDETAKAGLGTMTVDRWEKSGQQLIDLKVIDRAPSPAECFSNIPGPKSPERRMKRATPRPLTARPPTSGRPGSELGASREYRIRVYSVKGRVCNSPKQVMPQSHEGATMARRRSPRLGNLKALAKVVRSLPNPPTDAVARKRKMVAEFCQMLGAEYSCPPGQSIPDSHTATAKRLKGCWRATAKSKLPTSSESAAIPFTSTSPLSIVTSRSTAAGNCSRGLLNGRRSGSET